MRPLEPLSSCRWSGTLLLLTAQVQLAAVMDAGASAGAPQPLPPAVLRHFASVTATADFRHELVKAMRTWRRVGTGLPAFSESSGLCCT